MLNEVKYLVITPARNEEHTIDRTIRSMISQVVRPVEWVIVDDGSTDDTAAIVRKYQRTHGWIKLVQRPDRGFAEAGKGVMEAFYAGYAAKRADDFDFIVKLDGDLCFGATYFEKLFQEFKRDGRLGIAGGACYLVEGSQVRLEKNPVYHVRGATKVYRRSCWEQIGGVIKRKGWDTLDELMATYHGWKTRTFDELEMFHHRRTGENSGVFKWNFMLGKSDFYVGYHPLFALLKGLRRLLNRPYLSGGSAFLLGFFSNYALKNAERFEDREFRKWLKGQQIAFLTFRRSLYRP